MARHTISNGDDILDSRDIIARIEELEGDRETLADAVEEAREAETDKQAEYEALDEGERDHLDGQRTALADAVLDAERALSEWDDGDDAEELKALRAFADEGESNISDWAHGATLIRDDYFEAYAEQLADDIGAIGRDAKWPANHIDWEAAAQELQQDYSSIEWDGVTYWGQS